MRQNQDVGQADVELRIDMHASRTDKRVQHLAGLADVLSLGQAHAEVLELEDGPVALGLNGAMV